MKIALNDKQLSNLKKFLESYPDAEALSEREYVLDLYDLDPPVSMDLILGKDNIIVDGAAQLLFNEEMDGWYIGERIESPDAILSALSASGALQP